MSHPAPRPELAAGPVRSAGVHGLAVKEALGVPALASTRVLAGRRGLDRVIERLNVMEVPDILPWVKPHELLLTTAYPLRHEPDTLPGLVSALDDRGLAGLGIKLGRYIDAVPEALLERADALGFPVLQLPDGVGFDDILNEVLTEILNRQAAALARSERTHRALLQVVLTGGGLAELVEEVSALLGAPTAVLDTEGDVVAGARLETVDPALLTAVRDGGPTAAAGAGALAVPISAGVREHGLILAAAGDRPLSDDDRIALENAATVAALAVTKALAVEAARSKSGADLLHDLLAGRVTGAGEATARAAALGWDLDRPLALLVLEPVSGGEVSARTERVVTAAVRSHDPAAAVVTLSRELVVVCGTGDDAGAAGRTAETVERSAGAIGEPLSGGVSRGVDGPPGLETAYRQASAALRIGREVSGPGVITQFDDLGALRLLSLVPDHGELDHFVDEVLGPLADDEPGARDQRTTLATLLDTNLNVAASARRLHFHYNTVRYRLARLEETLGPFTTDARLRLDLLLALQIVRLRAARIPPDPTARPPEFTPHP